MTSAASSDKGDALKKAKTTPAVSFGGSFLKGGSLALALQANTSSCSKQRTSFLRTSSTGTSNESTASFQKSIAFNHVVFKSADNRSNLSNGSSNKQSRAPSVATHGLTAGIGHNNNRSGPSASLWSKVIATGGFHKTR